ncbi:SDR family oxidoreductase [Xylanimonas protaetiae]|uniref:SDR family NAD(P)-dependent oxidoreductase n=1 Tax=Xylanimonas protaetiae TaxID=2509457 RepID=A0A4P6FD53_9MICO|nr:SDR family NAD(P)-dependent oxidoreductase [Xylanimonas protaetiae]QAY71517.1 SDR family NAD(P)-dependent oxidoreductase [Xylanimonas protaetiae]
MDTQLEGTVALVTGASSGIGRAIALALVAQGARVVAGARRADRLTELVAEAGGAVTAVDLDVTDRGAVGRAVARTVAEHGRLDLLVNNAGLMLSGPIVGADPDEWERMVGTNLLGSMFVAHAALPHLLASRGTLVQVSSTSGRIASLGSGAYSATKFGVTAFAEALRQEVTAQGVRVVVVEPGFTATELTTHITDPAMRAMAASLGDSMRTLDPADIANAVVFAAAQPHHVSLNEILVRPTDQVA